MWKTVEVNCRDFACSCNKEGNCLLEKASYTPDGSGIVGHLICNEASETEPVPDREPDEKGGVKH